MGDLKRKPGILDPDLNANYMGWTRDVVLANKIIHTFNEVSDTCGDRGVGHAYCSLRFDPHGTRYIIYYDAIILHEYPREAINAVHKVIGEYRKVTKERQTRTKSYERHI